MKKSVIAIFVMAMLLAVTAPALALPERAPALRDDALNAALNVPGGTIAFGNETGGPVTPWVAENDYAVSTCHDSNYKSVLYAPVQLNEGEVLSFEYAVSCAPGDRFYFSIDNIIVRDAEFSGVIDWTVFRYTAPISGTYMLRWVYEKNSDGIDAGEDRAFLNNVAITSYDGPSFNEALNAEGSNIDFVRQGDSPWMVEGDYVVSTCYKSNSKSTIKASLQLNEGDIVSFDYAVSCDSRDRLFFDVRGPVECGWNFTEFTGEIGWTNFRYIAMTDGLYELFWIYEKNWDDISGGDDRACLDNVALIPYSGISLEDALNVEGGSIDFNHGATGFHWMVEDDYAVSTCSENGNRSMLLAHINLKAGDVISFDYAVSSHLYDKLSFAINGRTVEGASFSGEIEWTNFRFTVSEDAVYELRWTYEKNGDGIDAGEDRAWLDNIQINPPYEIGDVNMDGIISSGDATMLLRYSVGFMTMTDAQIALGDINFDGIVNTGDASWILRKIVGLL